MKFLWNDKDGGNESLVWCYGVEFKSLFSIMILNFKEGGRDVYHSHAFDCVSWVLYGGLQEMLLDDSETIHYKPNLVPVITTRERFHKVKGLKKNNWVITFRGPWQDKWHEEDSVESRTLTHGRKVIK